MESQPHDPSVRLAAALAAMRERQPDRDDRCELHGAFVSRNLLGKVWSRCPECEAAKAAEAAAAEERRETQRREQRHRDMLGSAGIPARFVGRSFANFAAPTPAHINALTTCRDYAESFAEQHRRRGTGLILSGLPGTGKSHLAAAILQHPEVFARDVRYATCMDVIRSVRDTWRRDSERTESQVLGYLQRMDLLVIDEIGMQYGTEGEQTILFDVLDRRYREVRPTVLLTNQDQAGMKQFVGERTFDRLAETCKWVVFDWPSFRPQARRDSALT